MGHVPLAKWLPTQSDAEVVDTEPLKVSYHSHPLLDTAGRKAGVCAAKIGDRKAYRF